MLRYLRAGNVKNGVLDLSDIKEMNFTPTEQATFRLRSGDVLVTEGSGSLRSVGANAVWNGEIDGTVCFQNTLLRLRPRDGLVSGPFLGWLCRSYFESGAFAAVAGGVNIFHLSANRVRTLPAPMPPLSEQVRIAAFLDVETHRIDTLIAEYQHQIELLREAAVSKVEALLWGGEVSELRRVADLLPGFAFPSSDFGPELTGPLLLRGANVAVGETNWKDTVRLDPDFSPDTRYELAMGDLVVGMDRPFISSGTRVAEIDKADAGSLLVQRVCRIRTRQPGVVAAAISGPRFKAYIESDLTGVSVPHLSETQIGRFLVPIGPLGRCR